MRLWSDAPALISTERVFERAARTLPEMIRASNRARLWLNPETCAALDRLTEFLVANSAVTSMRGMMGKAFGGTPHIKDWEAPMEQLSKMIEQGAEAIKQARHQVERELRSIVGMSGSPPPASNGRALAVLDLIPSALGPLMKIVDPTSKPGSSVPPSRK